MLGLRLICAGLLVVVLGGCGLYGEKGFTGNNRLSAPRFIEEVDGSCADANDSLDDEVDAALRADPTADEATDDGISSLRDAVDDLRDELPEHNGPVELEERRDAYVDVLETVDDQLGDAQDALDDGNEGELREHLTAAVGALQEAEKTLRGAGFEVCGVPLPAD